MPGLTYIADLVKSKAFKTLIILLVVACVVYYAIWLIYSKRDDQFTDIILNPVSLPTKYTPSLEKALTDYNCYFNPATIDKLAEARTLANSTLTANFNVVNSRINNMNTEIDNKLQELNYNLLKQIQKNYYNAHLLNNERERQKTMLDDLPMRNI